MFKRATKITSLLVAAASVMSLVPAYAADVKKIDSDDGTVYNAVAYKDGKFFVDGEINDDEEAYYVSDGKFNKLEDIDSGDDADLFGEKYLDINDGDYTVDLDKGSITDDDTKGDTADDAAEDLRKKVKDDTDDRYDENFAKTIVDENESDTEDLTKMNIVPGAKYKAPWYYTQYKAADKAVNDNVNGLKEITDQNKRVFNVYTDTKGGYIDADYNLGKVKVTTTANSASTKTETIENTNDNYDAAGKDDALTASVSQDKILTQDDDYIYRLATIKVNVTTDAGATARISEINGVELNPENANDKPQIFKVENDGRTVSFKAIQKISKAQDSDDVDGAKYAKTVTTYALSDEDGKNLDAKDLFLNTDGTINEDTKFTVANGKLIAYNTEMNEYKKVVVRAYSLKTKGGYYYADEEDESKEDCEVSSQNDKTSAVQTDVDGNLWRLDGGYIYKFDNTDDWDKVYKVDGSFDELSVYDKDNIAAWSEDDDVYSLIGGKSSDDNNTNPPTTTAGWVQATDGTWTYNKEDGTKATGWLSLNGVWYYLNTDGVMATGWLNLNGVWYYLNPSGAMATSWLNLNGTWYYLNSSGAMATGWLNDNGTWYYLNSSGAMLSNTTVDGYVLGSNGAWIR
ncbi:N-acetylmuramoyl-L-alanine amidase family protein [Clostridium beijerinckii]|uniref:N-acetylmuramoyl-L-alanine amidase family protein n=1 Tax=Clostridium beijerinckii TaxID=1520 RepID=UPI00157152E9|nr:N-acetylmuramoyl-L-alanine amidase family protein [Clostridium beijerinckii]NRT37466.1 glucan-binding YG repeat protein [Clostridium beijerinckii]NRT48792.1 glucan-binding YG repeat protein [Clostridium beijerinckii]NRZ22912.1 glucan-binding YG repeat protein [Clostridium beijerinckii]UYZ34686.1 N-acetylmuramoyl-L-alanine amidase family protein [Clostridium beijerinckii]